MRDTRTKEDRETDNIEKQLQRRKPRKEETERQWRTKGYEAKERRKNEEETENMNNDKTECRGKMKITDRIKERRRL